MKTLKYAVLAALGMAGLAAAQSADDMVGTWECRQPGVEYRNKPPILYVEGSSAKDPSKAIVLDVDGFTREVYGLSDVTADSDGWLKITPAQGQAFTVRPEGVTKSRTASMALRRAGATYRCLRLPPTGAQSALPSTGQTEGAAAKKE